MRRFLIVAAPFGVLGLGAAIMFALHAVKPEPEKVARAEARPEALFVAEVRREPVTLGVESQGEVTPRMEIDLVTQVSGRIVEVAPAFAEGGNVTAGETLVRIEPDDYAFMVTQAEARLAEAKLALAQEEARAEVARRQWQWEGIEDKPTPLALKEPHVAQARARARSAEADVENAKLNLSRTRITVPFDGRVREKSSDLGQFVSAGTRLGRVFSTEAVQIRLPLTDRQLAELELPIAFSAADGGEGPAVTLSARLAGELRHWQGRIVRTDAAIDSETRMFHAIVEVRDPYGRGSDGGVPLPVGMFVSARISGPEIADALVVPRDALRAGDQVYVVGEDNRLSIRSVEVISSDAVRAVIRSGVSEGERVVTSPVRAAREGMPVEPLDRASAAALALAND